MSTEMMEPAHKEAEFGLISRLLLKPSQMTKIADRVKPEHFYYDHMANIYDVMVSLYLRGKQPSLPLVADELLRRNLRDTNQEQVEYELGKYKHNDRVLGSVDEYADLIIRAAKNRRLLSAVRQITQAAYHQEENSVELAERLIMAIAMDSSEVEASDMETMMDRFEVEFLRRMKERSEGRVIGVRTGFRDVDKMIGALRPGSLNVISALTSVGKTAFAQNAAFNIIKHSGGRVLFFSLEMREYELMQRFVAMESHVDQMKIRDGEADQYERDEVLESIHRLRPLDFNATDKVYSLEGIKSVSRYMHMRKPLDLIIVDYLQLVDVTTEKGSKQKATYEEIGDISKGLLRLAQELNVPVLALAQLSKEASRKEKPELADIAGAYQIARDSDSVTILYITPDELAKRNDCKPYAVNYHVVKERNGRVGEVQVMFMPTQTRFTDVEY